MRMCIHTYIYIYVCHAHNLGCWGSIFGGGDSCGQRRVGLQGRLAGLGARNRYGFRI